MVGHWWRAGGGDARPPQFAATACWWGRTTCAPTPSSPQRRWGGVRRSVRADGGKDARDEGAKQDTAVSTTAGAASRPSRRRSNPGGRATRTIFVRGHTPRRELIAYFCCPIYTDLHITRAHCSVPTCTAHDVPQSVTLARRHARNLHANACRGSQTRCKPHGSRGRVPKQLLQHGDAIARATRCCGVQTMRAATCCMARAPRVAARALEVLQ